MKRFDILSLFPDYFEGPFNVSMIKRAREKGLLEINLVNMRDFAKGRYQQIDDRPYGGGPGMVLMAEPVTSAIRSVKSEKSHVVYLTPQGTPLTAKRCSELAEIDHLVVLCGHYEGIDERAIESEVDEEISIGDYVLTSGAPAATVLVDAVSRFIPGVIGNEEATRQDSFENGMFDAPVYTRPPEFEGKEVPPVLCQGHHAEIDAWREEKAREKTERVRPELIERLK
ncbi:tRNA (guanosine(37)-N1)-methyltransferase TrmD [Candidatus Neptunochlamydia vexilliferae]|uniref:tRNA (guanine-N(1)-)-methyltransferase n=1 Tax=Candidatus Neptunichlamydia vexilliferae TaxID=1651774 RepID=A0ABS0AZD1_9BACT|nr:tRNA (guanosine(37)-N1)-methyltransferase TrmD [Candidatus Neptunochlamydia vexilliferae]MBF5059498.1 tRNA (guanine-N(1)-)-methyltransferase [Candidatus Neptunochlamydia vexilliferae]